MIDNEQRAVAAYVEGRIEVEELEEALDHVHASRTGGLPYLSPFTEPVPEGRDPGIQTETSTSLDVWLALVAFLAPLPIGVVMLLVRLI